MPTAFISSNQIGKNHKNGWCEENGNRAFIIQCASMLGYRFRKYCPFEPATSPTEELWLELYRLIRTKDIDHLVVYMGHYPGSDLQPNWSVIVRPLANVRNCTKTTLVLNQDNQANQEYMMNSEGAGNFDMLIATAWYSVVMEMILRDYLEKGVVPLEPPMRGLRYIEARKPKPFFNRA